MPNLNNYEKIFCERPICEADILKSIISYPQEKTPRSDGLSALFYKFFWSDIKIHIPNIIYVMEKCALSIEWKRGIIKLLPKKGKHRLLLKSWRP